MVARDVGDRSRLPTFDLGCAGIHRAHSHGLGRAVDHQVLERLGTVSEIGRRPTSATAHPRRADARTSIYGIVFRNRVEVLACGESRSPAAGSRRPDGRQPW